jgi:dihydroorotate dehydrogenase electron transfer subunit
MRSVETNVIENIEIARDFYRLRFFWDKNWGRPQAGNFCEIKVNNLSAPLLRRPFAFSDFNEKENFAEIIYQKRGTATEVLSLKKSIKSTFDSIDNQSGGADDGFLVSFEDDFAIEKILIIAPLGNSFYYTPDIADKKRIFAVAGGIGLGPILFAAKTSPFPLELIAGFRNGDFVPDSDIFRGINTRVCTDDGSDGFRGNVIDYLSATDIGGDDLIIACGPTPMLKALHNFAVVNNIACKVSMEEMMACGVGACMGCVVETVDGMKRVCREGPVFASRELKW